MRLANFKVENYRRLLDLEIKVREHLVLIGANDVGKSSLLRCLDLLLGASTAQLYSRISVDDFRVPDQPFVIEATLTDFTDKDRALFPDEIWVDPVTNTSHLVVRLTATVDDSETVTIERHAPEGGTGRQLSRDQVLGLGWKLLSATAQTRDIREDRRSSLDEILQAVELGDEQASFEAITRSLTEALGASNVLRALRGSLSAQLSKALPEKIAQDDLSFVPGAAADNDVLSDVRLQVHKGGVPHELSEQSDGTRALFAIALYDLMSVGANMVGIDEPEIHLHPSSQRSLARLLKASANQKVLATHSADIVGAFEPDSVVVVRPGGVVVQPKAGFLSDDERLSVRMWVRDRLEPLTSRRVVAVEGLSDRIILERLADVTDRNLDRLGVSLIEAGGFGDMGPLDKLFGIDGFRVPFSRLIDEDAEGKVANQLGVEVSDLASHSVWVSRADLEEEYVRALGATNVWEAFRSTGHFSRNELGNCIVSAPSRIPTEAELVAFCRRSRTYKVKAALSVLSLFTADSARRVSSIESLLEEVGE
ncbi:hypothetical protein CVCC1112_714 [Paenarthrobacter nicotinovorans]|uniref:ATP-dependent nuclease n=1 Tax=Paenarthrobacter nicotinovorans TaxID=29320 RepID=UPI0007CC365A|nr:AAA family ATPase [Paenarthrobacter nicotinovorans]GAT86054.1 hypothetical protein CVCC1112_714 [Paenarthrobacter nicotinovorans]